MRKFNLFLTGINQRIEFYLPEFRGSRLESFVKLIILLLSSVLFIFTSGIFAIGTFEYGVVGIENGLFNFQIILSLIFLGLLLTLICFNGFRRFVDPNNFISVLVFALFAISSAIFAIPVSISNTFGVTSFRSIAGFFIVSTLGIFYLINFVIQDKRILRKFFYAYTLLSAFSIFIIYFQGLFIDPKAFTIVTPVLFVSTINLAFFAIYVRRFKRAYALLAGLSVFGLGIILATYDRVNYVSNFVYLVTFLFSASLTLFIILLIYWRKSSDVLRKYYEQVLNNLLERSQSKSQKLKVVSQKSSNWAWIYFVGILLPLVMFIFAVLLSWNAGITLDKLLEGLVNIQKSISSMFSISQINATTISKLIFGGGASIFAEAILNNYHSFPAYIVQVQGLLGLFAYVFIWIYGIYKTIMTFSESFNREQEYKLLLPFVFMIIFVPIFGIFQNLSIFLNILWWLSFGIISAYSKINKLNPSTAFVFNDYAVDSFKPNILRGKRSIILKFIILIVIWALLGIILYSLSTLNV